MAEKKGFDLAALMKGVADLNDGQAERIELLPFESLREDPGNFYSMDGLEALADSISTVGLLDPIRVRQEDGHYVVISGHRRRAAIGILIEGGEERWKEAVPCIVDRGEELPELTRLKLIMANSATRQKSSAELSREAEEIKELLIGLREKGFPLPGRLSSYVAEAIGVKESKLKRLHAIRGNAEEYILNAYDTGRLNENTAYLLSQHPQEYQHMIWVEYARAGQPQDRLTGDVAATIRSAELLMENHKCPLSPGICSVRGSRFSEGLRRRFEGSKVGNCQKGGCCKGCPALLECEAYCFKCKAERQRKEAEQAARRAELEKIHRDAEAQRAQAAETVPSPIPEGYTQTGLLFDRVQRIRRAAEASGADLRHVFSMRSLSERDLETYLSIINGGPDPTHELDELFDNTEELADLADDLECSTDFLLGRSEEPGINRGGDQKAGAWQTGTPKKKGWYVAKVSRLGEKTGAPMLLLWGDNGWSVAGGAATIHSSYTIEQWIRIPD